MFDAKKEMERLKKKQKQEIAEGKKRWEKWVVQTEIKRNKLVMQLVKKDEDFMNSKECGHDLWLSENEMKSKDNPIEVVKED